jgi:hypothetical protein
MPLAEVKALIGEPPTYSLSDRGLVPSQPVRVTRTIWKGNDVRVVVTSDDSGEVLGKHSRWDREPALPGWLPEGAAQKWREWFPERLPPMPTPAP